MTQHQYSVEPFVIQHHCSVDDRGVFKKIIDGKIIYGDLGLPIIQEVNLVKTSHSHTFRGFHYQKEPFAEYKLITVVTGKILDLVVDVRETSSNYLQVKNFELAGNDDITLFIPTGFAHGYLTLEPNTTVMYGSTNNYNPNYENGIRWDDPKIHWDFPKPNYVSIKDESWGFL